VTSDDVMSVLDCVDENLSEVHSSDSDNEIDAYQESVHKSITSDNEQSNSFTVV
jgi:hypothetical protein